MIKKIVWLPYDFDTALGINNEGALVFDYDLEDIDHLSGGADVYNGQESVIWKNVRRCFFEELKSMYQTLRSQSTSTTGLSYEAVEKMFEDHQSKWPEAIFNEDAWFKYIEPLINPSAGKEPTAAYLSMLQGSKEEQRKWWLYNRFKYIDSKYNAGSALTDYIQVRGYAKSNITITPYATIYPTVKFGSYLVQERGTRGQATTLVCPLDNVNDTEIYIYSASQLASVGDLSGFKVGFADFSMATKLQNIKLGDSSSSYTNPNLKELYLGNNVLLKTIDVRNCTALGSGDMKVVNVSGCTGLKKAWFTGTQISALTLPTGGVLDELALPATITNLTIRNQPELTTFSITGNSYTNVSTCRIENTPYFTESETAITALMTGLPDNCRLRLVGLDIDWLADTDEIDTFYDSLDRFRGLDISGGNLDDAYVEGVIHINSAKGSDIAALKARYPYLDIDATHTESTLTYMDVDNETVWQTETIYDGGNGTKNNTFIKADSSDGHYRYTANGWTTTPNGASEADALNNVIADRVVYPAFTATVRTYTVTWVNNGTTIETDNNVAWGTVPHYDGPTPTKDGQTSTGWLPDPTQPITGNTTFTSQYLPVYTVTFKNDTGSTTLDTQSVVQGGTATYGGTTPTSSEDASLAFLGWATSANSHTANAVLTNVQASMIVYAAFESSVEVVEITDTWDQIIANIDNGTYSTRYKVGNYKPLDLGTEGTINMQIVAIDADELASGGYAPLTFLGMELLNTGVAKNSSGGKTVYSDSSIRTYLANTIRPLIPSNVSDRIQVVNKTSLKNATYGTIETTQEELWIPSHREIFNDTSEFNEPQGVTYITVYKEPGAKIKHTANTTSASMWWLRSISGSGSGGAADAVDINGRSNPRTSWKLTGPGVCLGFCLGLENETIEDSWETILANENYATDYSIGDTKMLDLGTEGKHFMEIVAFDTDDRADGQGKAGITWISKDLLPTIHAMNSTEKTVDGETTRTAGGWENSDMRTWLKETVKPLIPSTVRNGIVEVTKVQSIYTNGAKVIDGQTTTDDVWIPSNHEVGLGTSYESTGAVYSSKFTNSTAGIKKRNGSASFWWLRSVSNANGFRIVSRYGSDDYRDASSSLGVALGFCTN